MADTKRKHLVTNVPLIGGPEMTEYWIGDREIEAGAALLKLSITPMQSLQMFGAWAAEVQQKGEGLPAHVHMPWIFTSLATEKLRKENASLEARVEELETHVGALEDRLTALETHVGTLETG